MWLAVIWLTIIPSSCVSRLSSLCTSSDCWRTQTTVTQSELDSKFMVSKQTKPKPGVVINQNGLFPLIPFHL